RRHTRWPRDWSSDVCSSDLVVTLASVILGALAIMLSVIAMALAQDTVRVRGTIERIDGSTYMVKARDGAELKVTLADSPQIAGEIGRASCRERGESGGVVVS